MVPFPLHPWTCLPCRKVFLWKNTIENLILLKERFKNEEKNKLKNIVLGGWVPKAKKFFLKYFLVYIGGCVRVRPSKLFVNFSFSSSFFNFSSIKSSMQQFDYVTPSRRHLIDNVILQL